MGNNNIKEIFKICEIAKSKGQTHIPVHIYPINFNNIPSTFYLLSEIVDKDNLKFEYNLKEGFDLFEQNKYLPSVSVDSGGRYLYSQ